MENNFEVLNDIKPSFSILMNEKVKLLQKQGKKIINLTIGDPDLDLDNIIKDKLWYSVDYSFSHYTDKSGIEELRNSILKWNNYRYDYNLNNLVVTPGCKYAIYVLIKSLINQGDEVIILKPYWVSYIEIVKLCGGIPVVVGCNDDFTIDFNDLISKITNRTKTIILNNPNNPSGKILSEIEMEILLSITKQYNIHLISDEIYSEISFKKFISFADFVDLNRNDISVINGVSKSLSCTGLRIGYVIARKDLIDKFLGIHQHIATCAGSLEQKALSLLTHEEYQGIVRKNVLVYLQRKNLLQEAFKESKVVNDPDGTFYMLVNIKEKYRNSEMAANILLQDYGIAVVPGSAYGIDDYVRIALTKSLDEIKEFINIANTNKLF